MRAILHTSYCFLKEPLGLAQNEVLSESLDRDFKHGCELLVSHFFPSLVLELLSQFFVFGVERLFVWEGGWVGG